MFGQFQFQVFRQKKGDVAALTRSSLICWENNTPNKKTMDPSPENNGAAWYQGPMKLKVAKSCGATPENLSWKDLPDESKIVISLITLKNFQTSFQKA